MVMMRMRLGPPFPRQWNRSGALTVCEAEGLNGVMAMFLQRAVPLLADHYNQLQGEPGQVRGHVGGEGVRHPRHHGSS